MHQDHAGSARGRTRPPPDGSRQDSDLAALGARCEHQTTVIAALNEAVSVFTSGMNALKAENCELRADNERLRNHQRFIVNTYDRPHGAQFIEVSIPLDAQAPRAARGVVTRFLTDLVAPHVLADAQLLVTELVTNSLRYSGSPDGDDVIVRVDLETERCRVEVEDSGSDGVIAPQPLSVHADGGRGLYLVQAMSDRWGVVRGTGGPTRVWAQLPLAAGLA